MWKNVIFGNLGKDGPVDWKLKAGHLM